MIKSNCDIMSLKNLMLQKRIVVFGASKHLYTLINREKDLIALDNIAYIVDNNVNIQGTKIDLFGKMLEVKDPSELIHERDVMLLIATAIPQTAMAILQQLENMKLDDSVECYSLLAIENTHVYDDGIMQELNLSGNTKIPKIIHSFWFSGEKKPEKYQKCIDSWKRFCPDYDIIEWNSDNYDISKNMYMKQTFERKRWAFVSDYARLDVICNFGGVYMDMDVELLKPIDSLLANEAFFSFDNDRYVDLGSGFGAVKNHPLVCNLLEQYDNITFEENITEGKYALPQPARLISVFEQYGFKRNAMSQVVRNSLFLSPNYFKIIDGQQTERDYFSGEEYAIHWHNAGWWSQQMRDKRDEIKILIENVLNEFQGKKV